MADDMRKLAMPEDSLVERGLTRAQRAERQRRLAQWREETGEDVRHESQR